MKLMIGENIRRLRRDKDVTQEQLAEIFGVSYQSVSRWENGMCYPDMELLPTIAQFFGTTVDSLMGVNEQLEKKKVDAYLLEFQNAISVGNVEECIRVARAGVAEFPNNYKLLNKLMYALFIAGDDDGNIPEWKENMQTYDAEITALGERIMKYCPEQEIRLEATARLAFNHCEMGRKEQGRAIYEMLPTSEFCRENQMWWALKEEEKLPFIRQKIKNGYEMMQAGMYTLLWVGLLPDEDVVKIFEKRLALENILYDGEEPVTDRRKASDQVAIARVYARLGNAEKSLEHLRKAVDYAREYDVRPESGVIESLLLGYEQWHQSDFETSDSRSCCEILRDKWMASKDFDKIREREEFKEILELLNTQL